MNFLQNIDGAVEVELLSADLPRTLDAVRKAGIIVSDAVSSDEFHLRFIVSRRDLALLSQLARKRGDELTICRRIGLFFRARAAFRRPILTFGLFFLFLLSLRIPSRVLIVEIEGNSSIPSAQIAQAAVSCGIRFGASREQVRSEKVKNALLAALPELQWAGVNTYGCRAVITVRERASLTENDSGKQVSSIVAACDGIVREMTVEKGNALCTVGQAVKKGEVLISAYTDCGICIRATHAQGQIYADTRRTLTAVMPVDYAQRTRICASGTNYSLIIGKKRINLRKNSGNPDGRCAKIYEQIYLTLPGGYQLPIALCREQWYDYDVETVCLTDTELRLSEFAARYLPQQMVSGSIGSTKELFFVEDGYTILRGSYGCYEMIAITRSEEQLYA